MVQTVPCKYKTGKVLGNGTYATVKGELIQPFTFCHHANRLTCQLAWMQCCKPRGHACKLLFFYLLSYCRSSTHYRHLLHRHGLQIETGKYYAVKIINKTLMEGREHMIRNEINVLRRISQNHNNILSLVDYFETLNNRESNR